MDELGAENREYSDHMAERRRDCRCAFDLVRKNGSGGCRILYRCSGEAFKAGKKMSRRYKKTISFHRGEARLYMQSDDR